QPNQDGDNGNHHQQLNQREASLPADQFCEKRHRVNLLARIRTKSSTRSPVTRPAKVPFSGIKKVIKASATPTSPSRRTGDDEDGGRVGQVQRLAVASQVKAGTQKMGKSGPRPLRVLGAAFRVSQMKRGPRRFSSPFRQRRWWQKSSNIPNSPLQP